MTARVNLIEKMSDGHSITIKLAFRLGGEGGATSQGHVYTFLLLYKTQISVAKENNALFV